MAVQAITRDSRISPRKVRLVADAIRGIASVDEALGVLALMRKRGAAPLEKTLLSAVANGINNAKIEKDNLTIDRIEITEGQAFKRFHPSTRGRVHPYKKRSSHIRIILKEKIVAATPVAIADKKGDK